MVKKSKVSNTKEEITAAGGVPPAGGIKRKKEEKDAKKDLAYFKELARKNLAGWQRARADYHNLVKRNSEENAKNREYANEGLILELLPIVDNFQHASNHLPSDLKDNDWVQGVLFVRTQLEKILSDQGVVPIAAVGKKFDPEKHEATEKEKVKDKKKKDMVLSESQKGYSLNGKVIRAARVKVGI